MIRITMLSRHPVNGRWPLSIAVDGCTQSVGMSIPAGDVLWEQFYKRNIEPCVQVLDNTKQPQLEKKCGTD